TTPSASPAPSRPPSRPPTSTRSAAPSNSSPRPPGPSRDRSDPMANFRLTLSYDGTDFHGWQPQPELRTVQQTLEAAVAAVPQEERARVNASGRTDTGVHAVGQVVNFHSATRLAPAVLL